MALLRKQARILCLCSLVMAVTALNATDACWAATPQANAPGTIIAAFHCDYPPVSFWDKNTQRPSGFFVDVMNAVAKDAGLQVGYICKSGWPELISAVETGEADMTVLLKSAEREKILLFSSPIDITYLSFFARSHSSIDPDSMPQDQTIGVIKGSMSYEQLKNRPGIRLHILGSYHEGIFSLLAGEIGLFAGEESMILKRARETRLDNRIKRVGKPFVERERGIAVRRDHAALLEVLNRPLSAFIGSDEYQQIYLKWYGASRSEWTEGRIIAIGAAVLAIVVFGMAFWRYRSLSRINTNLVEQIAERRKAETELALFRNLVNKSGEAIFVNDPETGRFLDMNERACASLGYDRSELLAMGVRDIEMAIPSDILWQDHVDEVRQHGFLLLEGLHRRKDGSTFPVETSVSCVKLDSGEYMVAVVRDITERKLSEAALRKREEQLTESQRIARLGSWEHNPRTGEIYWSDELFHLLGLDPATDRADFGTFFARIHPEDQPLLKAAVETSLREKKPFDIEYRFVIPGQPVKIIHARADLVPDSNGDLSILRGTGLDITERKRDEEKIRQNEQFIRNILDTVDEGFMLIDRHFRILTANKAYCSQTGTPCEDVIGRHCFEISHRKDKPCYEEGEDCPVREAYATGVPHAALHKHTDQDGHVLYMETKAFPVRDAAGNVSSVIATVNNITERHLLEEERLKTQKLESIGTLAGGIAHDFNNLLQGIFGYISLAKMTFENKEKSFAMLEQAEKALHQSVNLTTQLLTFSKGGTPVKKPVDLRTVIENAARFALSGSRADYRLDIEPALWHAEADGGQIGQVIQNIVLNADQAMPEGGQVVVAAKNIPKGRSLPHGLARGSYIRISVQDTGVGIPPQYLNRIFDPYFTTKEKGSGLGLATSYSIVKNHGGVIDVSSKAGKGSMFSIYLPAVVRTVQSEAEAQPPEESPQRRARVLVMDDEDMVRFLSREMLGSLGHEVDVAQHGQEAIEKYKAALPAGQRFDVVILDLTVRGGMGGADALKKLLEIDPAVTAIVSTGYSDDSAIANHLSLGFKAYLKKPYDIVELKNTLHTLQI